MEKRQYLEAGEIVNTHGIRGEVQIVPWADDAAFLRKFKTFYIDNKPVRVERSIVHKKRLVAKFEGVEDINAAMPLKGKVIFKISWARKSSTKPATSSAN